MNLLVLSAERVSVMGLKGFSLGAVTVGFSWTLFVIPALQDSRNTELKYENTQICFVNLQSAAQNAVKTGNYCEL